MFALADCNNFFASCERVFRPDLQNKPVIVLSNNDGCAIARSNEAKALGIKMGDPYFKIKHLVEKHQVAVFSGNMALYGDMSQRVRWVLEDYAPAIEVYSIDEAFLDLRAMPANINFDAYAKEISRACRKLTAIPVSVGIAPTKTLAKIASKLCKQYPKLQGGCYMHRAEDIEKVLRKFPLADVWGIGRKSAAKLQMQGLRSAYDLTQKSETWIRNYLGSNGLKTWRELRGTACIEFEDHFEAKQSICVSRSFASEIESLSELSEQVANFCAEVAVKLRAQHSLAGEIVVFAYTNRFKENLPQCYGNEMIHFEQATADTRPLVKQALTALESLFRPGYAYKKAGVIATHIIPEQQVMHSLFEDSALYEREQKITATIDQINRQFGQSAIRLAIQGNGQIKSSSALQSPHYSTRWSDLPQVSVK